MTDLLTSSKPAFSKGGLITYKHVDYQKGKQIIELTRNKKRKTKQHLYLGGLHFPKCFPV